MIPTLDAYASAAKSDSLVNTELREALQAVFHTLKADHESSPDWHPATNGMVQDLVHPSMYPLVYGRTRVHRTECVVMKDAISHWAGTGNVIPVDNHSVIQGDHYTYQPGGTMIPPNFWSNTYQWLPANVSFRDNGEIQFTSYINNLHPVKYAGVYRTIEGLIERALPLWDQCLAMVDADGDGEGAGRLHTRIKKPQDTE